MANDLAKDTNKNRDVEKNNSKSFEIFKIETDNFYFHQKRKL